MWLGLAWKQPCAWQPGLLPPDSQPGCAVRAGLSAVSPSFSLQAHPTQGIEGKPVLTSPPPPAPASPRVQTSAVLYFPGKPWLPSQHIPGSLGPINLLACFCGAGGRGRDLS